MPTYQEGIFIRNKSSKRNWWLQISDSLVLRTPLELTFMIKTRGRRVKQNDIPCSHHKKVTLRKIEFVEVLKCLLRLTTSNNSFVLLFIVYSLSDGITGSMLTRHYSVLIFELFCRYSWMKRHVLCLGQLRYEACTMYSEIASVLETSILLTLLVKSNHS